MRHLAFFLLWPFQGLFAQTEEDLIILPPKNDREVLAVYRDSLARHEDFGAIFHFQPHRCQDRPWGCGQEAVRIIGQLPKWNPGKKNGLPVRSRQTFPFRYKLE